MIAFDIGEHGFESALLGPEHWAAMIAREAISIDIYKVDVAGALGKPFI
jgi:hypothetical protein